MTTLRATRLTTFSVADDGASIALGVVDHAGGEAAVVVPTECLKTLMMTLPEMMRQALRLRHRDPSLRLVYPLASWDIELSTEPGTLILPLRTSDNFQVSFALNGHELQEMIEATQAEGDAIGRVQSVRQATCIDASRLGGMSRGDHRCSTSSGASCRALTVCNRRVTRISSSPSAEVPAIR